MPLKLSHNSDYLHHYSVIVSNPPVPLVHALIRRVYQQIYLELESSTRLTRRLNALVH
jgi:hypothetical protein